MGKPNIPNPGQAAAAGISTDTQLQPFNYLVNAASTLGQPISIAGPNGQQRTYDFTGLGQADVAGKVSDQMAQTLLDLQKETSPTIIQQRLDELKAADPEGYNARKELFDRISADAQANPGRPVNTALQQQLQTELAKGAGFDDLREQQQFQDQARGAQVMRGIYLGNAPAAQEAQEMLSAGDQLRNQREQNSLNLLQSGASPQDIQYRQMQQAIGNLGAFANGQTPTAEFKNLSSAGQGPAQMYPGAPNTNTFNPNAAGQGFSNALGIYQGQLSQANPWLAGAGVGASTFGSLAQINPSWFNGGGGGSYYGSNGTQSSTLPWQSGYFGPG